MVVAASYSSLPGLGFRLLALGLCLAVAIGREVRVPPRTVPDRRPRIHHRGVHRITLKCATRRTHARTAHYLGYGGTPYVTNYPIGVSVPSFLRGATSKSFSNTVTIVHGDSLLPTIYNHIYPRRDRYRGGYALNGTLGSISGTITVKEIRHFLTSLRHRDNGRGPTRITPRANGEITVINSNPTKVATTTSLHHTNRSIAIFRTFRGPNNILICNVPRFHLPGTVIRGRVSNLGGVKIGVRAGFIINHAHAVPSLVSGSNFSTIFINDNTNLPGFVGVPNRGLINICSTGRCLAHTGLVGTCSARHTRAPIIASHGITILNNNGITVSTTHVTLHLKTRRIRLVCHHARGRVPTHMRRIRRTGRRNIAFRVLRGTVRVLNSSGSYMHTVHYVHFRLNRPSTSNHHDPMRVGNDRFSIRISAIVITVNGNSGPLVSRAARNLRIGGHNGVIISRGNGDSVSNVCTNKSVILNTTAIVLTVNRKHGTTTTVGRCLTG